ncbi:GtrA family protein [Synechococcus sp. CBW1107]|uniref:GtrA family protein n=2 Tax=unclassified Synechococcus TaxID=2626047 RepID=UPI002AD52B60|nr:GtrA family protein [Synechococcus sp. CBW1107]
MMPWFGFGEIRRFLLGGSLNTIIGSASIAVLQMISNNLLVSNVGGYIIGSISGYAIHSTYTFKTPRSKSTAKNYTLIIGISYFVNLGALYSAYAMTGKALLSQAIAMGAYITVSFLLQARFAFPVNLRKSPKP